MMTAEMATLTKQYSTMASLLTEIRQLKLKNMEQENTIKLLEDRVSDLEQYSRINNVIISGLATRPRTYSKAVKGTASQDETVHEESTEDQVIAFFKGKDIDIDGINIEACHTLPVKEGKNKPTTPAIIIRFANRKHKVSLLKQGYKLEGSNVSMNEHLTKRNADISWRARQLKKQGKIQSTWSVNCKVFIKPVGAPENSRGLCIKSADQLEKYK